MKRCLTHHVPDRQIVLGRTVSFGKASSQVFPISNLGHVAKALGDDQQAEQYFRQALAMAMEIQMPPLALDILTGMVDLLAQTGETERALDLGTFVPCHSAAEQQLKDRLGPLHAELVARAPQQVTVAA